MILGPIGANSGFAFLQSAAMGGYGANAVNLGTRASVALASLVRCGIQRRILLLTRSKRGLKKSSDVLLRKKLI